MRMKVRIVAIMVAAVPALPAAAQVPWDSPQLVSPHVRAGAGLYFVDFGQRPHDGVGVLLTYRPADGPGGIGVRMAATYPQNDDVRVSGGADVSVPLLERSETFPLDVVWLSGLGLAWGDYLAVGVPVGISAGRPMVRERVSFAPYMGARLVLEAYAGGGRPAGGFGSALAVEVGADAAFTRSRAVVLRAAASLGDRRALLVGLQLARRPDR